MGGYLELGHGAVSFSRKPQLFVGVAIGVLEILRTRVRWRGRGGLFVAQRFRIVFGHAQHGTTQQW